MNMYFDGRFENSVVVYLLKVYSSYHITDFIKIPKNFFPHFLLTQKVVRYKKNVYIVKCSVEIETGNFTTFCSLIR